MESAFFVEGGHSERSEESPQRTKTLRCAQGDDAVNQIEICSSIRVLKISQD
jgi:hypothetical protein